MLYLLISLPAVFDLYTIKRCFTYICSPEGAPMEEFCYPLYDSGIMRDDATMMTLNMYYYSLDTEMKNEMVRLIPLKLQECREQYNLDV